MILPDFEIAEISILEAGGRLPEPPGISKISVPSKPKDFADCPFSKTKGS